MSLPTTDTTQSYVSPGGNPKIPPVGESAPIIPQKENFIKEFFKFLVLALVIVIPVRTYIAQPFVVQGASMDPTFVTGQYLIVDQLTYHFKNPVRGDVIILKYPREPRTFFIKRIVGLPGETIEIKDGKVTIKNKENPRGIILKEAYVTKEHLLDDSYEMTLDNDEYFVLGDNRAQSSDSRSWGALPRDLIVGRPLLRLLPITTFSVFPGDIAE